MTAFSPFAGRDNPASRKDSIPPYRGKPRKLDGGRGCQLLPARVEFLQIGRTAMKTDVVDCSVAAAGAKVQPAVAQGNAGDLGQASVAGQGGAEALRGLTGLTISGDARFWEPDSRFWAGGRAAFPGDEASFEISWESCQGWRGRIGPPATKQYPPPAAKLKIYRELLPRDGALSPRQWQPANSIASPAAAKRTGRAAPSPAEGARNPGNIRRRRLRDRRSLAARGFPHGRRNGFHRLFRIPHTFAAASHP